MLALIGSSRSLHSGTCSALGPPAFHLGNHSRGCVPPLTGFGHLWQFTLGVNRRADIGQSWQRGLSGTLGLIGRVSNATLMCIHFSNGVELRRRLQNHGFFTCAFNPAGRQRMLVGFKFINQSEHQATLGRHPVACSMGGSVSGYLHDGPISRMTGVDPSASSHRAVQFIAL